MTLPPFLTTRPLKTAALFYAAVAIACTQIPLLDYLGYEFSALTALLGSFVAGFTTMGSVGKICRETEGDPATRAAAVARALGKAALANVLLLLIPLVLLTANALNVRNCSLTEGLGFFILLPIVSALFGVGLGFFCVAHYGHPRTVFIFICGLLLGYSIGLGYLTPAVFSYNFLYGFFPGLTYDEALPLSNIIILFRLITLLVAAVLVWMGMVLVMDCDPSTGTARKGLYLLEGLVAPGRRFRTAGIVLALSTAFFYRCELGFESTAQFIQHSLGGQYITEHFVIYYSPTSFTDEEIRRAGIEHEFRLHQVLTAFALPRGIMLESYVYPSPEAKQRFIGAGNTDIAKPWSGQIHLSKQSLEGSLKHELVHAAAAPFGLPVIRASLSTGLVEGLAMAVDGEWGNRTLHEYAAAMRRYGADHDIRSIMSLWGFAAQQSSVSYVLAGSFCKYLIDRYGMRKMMQLYRSGNYAAVYGRSLDELVHEWHRYLERVPLEDNDSDGVDALFRRPTIFSKVCARTLARRNMQARGAFLRKEYAVAESLYAQSYADGHGYDAFAGRLASALRLGKYTVLTTAMETVILADEHPARYLSLFLGIGDAYWATGATEKAYTLYDRVYHADISEAQTEGAALRIIAMREDDRGGRYLPLFLLDAADTVRASVIDSVWRLDRDNHLLRYLKGRTLMRLSDPQGAVAALERARFMELDQDLEALRCRFLGQALFRLGKYNDARTTFWTSLNVISSNIAQERVNTWIDRCEWMMIHDF